MSGKKSIIVIGGGVAGYPAAIKAARLGAEVTLIEKDLLGGTCLNRGCIPTKSLLQSADVVRTIKESETFGIKAGSPEINFPAVMDRKEKVVGKLRSGVESLVKAKKIKVIKGTAEIADKKTVIIKESSESIKCDAMIIATGSIPATLPVPGLDKSDPFDSTDFLNMKELPVSSAIIGGGVVGVELSQILVGLGMKATILELMPQIIPGLDAEISKALENDLLKQGIEIVTSAKVTEVKKEKKRYTISYKSGDENKKITVDRVISAAGRKPFMGDLNVEKLGIKVKSGAIVVNKRMETNVNGIYAVGDVNGGIMLAHAASAEGECAAVNAMDGNREVDEKAIPSCIYTHPEVASVGLSEEEAKKGNDIEVGRFPFAACGKALVLNSTSGMVKIIADKKHGEVLGVHIIGPHATDLIAEAVLGMTLESTTEEFAHAVHPHPTLSETIMEAALSITGGAIHMP